LNGFVFARSVFGLAYLSAHLADIACWQAQWRKQTASLHRSLHYRQFAQFIHFHVIKKLKQSRR
jgi:hypothetical protein